MKHSNEPERADDETPDLNKCDMMSTEHGHEERGERGGQPLQH